MGGGIRWTLEPIHPKSIMMTLDAKVDATNQRPLRPCHFDLIAGTSTGGLVDIKVRI
jgi:patatin-like phospholipase/acyl hydrolase